jgi:hypothetical protein
MVESVGDPLRYSDDELTEGLARIFAAAAKMPRGQWVEPGETEDDWNL